MEVRLNRIGSKCQTIVIIVAIALVIVIVIVIVATEFDEEGRPDAVLLVR